MSEKQFKRELKVPKSSFFLFGPRGTGKTTWLIENFKEALMINLLKSKDYRALLNDPSLLESWISAQTAKTIVVDEIQKLPELLDEIQSLMLEKKSLQFVLTGSSARKLKKMKANLLAGRARTREFFSLTSAEMDFEFNLQDILKYGCLPETVNLKTKEEKIDYLESYVQTYLNEEIKQEAIVRALEPFIRFLEVSAIMNGQIWNCSEISREVGCGRTTVEGYLSVMIDTLIGYRIEAFRPRAKVKEKHNPKYYYFDPGVVRALSGNLNQELDSGEIGYLFETFILNELKAYSSYRQKNLKIYYWGTPSKNEVDFVIDDGRNKIALELKTSKNWKSEFNTGIQTLLEEKKIKSGYGICDGERSLVSGEVRVFPVKQFLKKLWSDEIFS